MKKKIDHEYDFALVVGGVNELTDLVSNALFESGCDDATFSIQHGVLYAEFSRRATSLEDAILSAIRDVRNAGIGAEILQVDQCDLVTQAEIARRTGRTRQLICQYIKGTRGPGAFPPPACHLVEDMPLWTWCAVTNWLAKNNLIRADEVSKAQVFAIVNLRLQLEQLEHEFPDLSLQVKTAIQQPARRALTKAPFRRAATSARNRVAVGTSR
jgi:hypothetical protein